MNKAIFLDRDGVINVERGEYTWRKQDFKFTTDIIPFLQRTRELGYLLIVITNQGGIAKGLYSHNELDELHTWMKMELAKERIRIDDVFYSPYHDNFSKSLSRKPDSIMIEKALQLYNIDAAKSYFVGDSERDIQAAEKVKVRGLKIEANGPLLPLLEQMEV